MSPETDTTCMAEDLETKLRAHLLCQWQGGEEDNIRPIESHGKSGDVNDEEAATAGMMVTGDRLPCPGEQGSRRTGFEGETEWRSERMESPRKDSMMLDNAEVPREGRR